MPMSRYPGPGLHQVQHLPGRQVALFGNAVDPKHLQILLSFRQHRQTALKQRLGDRQKGPLPGRQHFAGGLDPHLSGAAHQFFGSVGRLFKGRPVGIGRIAGQGHGQIPARHQLLQNGHVLPGEIREAHHIKSVRFRKIPVRQFFQQPIHLISGVLLAVGAKAVVGFQNQGQFLQLLGKIPFRLPGGVHQVLRGNAAALEFVHGVDQFREEFRPGLHRSVGLQLAVKLPHGGGHGNHPSALVQTFLRRSPNAFRHPPGQTGEGQNLGIAAGGIPGPLAKPPLHIVADEFRYQKNALPLPLRHIPGQTFQNLVPVGQPILAEQ